LEILDELFLIKLNSIVKICTESFKKYEYSRVKQEVEQFFWKDFCDNYLEIVKKRVYQGEGNAKLSAQYTLYYSLFTILKLIAPIMPFITEEIYSENFRKNEKIKSIHLSNWPKYERIKNFEALNKFYEILSKIRQEKSNNKKAMNAEIKLGLEEKDYNLLGNNLLSDLQNVTNAREIKKGKQFEVEFI
jgi:valyl-tRNA synthetase